MAGFLHVLECTGQSAIWHSLEQYFFVADMHLLHRLKEILRQFSAAQTGYASTTFFTAIVCSDRFVDFSKECSIFDARDFAVLTSWSGIVSYFICPNGTWWAECPIAAMVSSSTSPVVGAACTFATSLVAVSRRRSIAASCALILRQVSL